MNTASITGCVNTTFNNVKTNNGGLTFTSCTNTLVDGHDYIERLFGNTNTSGNTRPLNFSNCTNLVYQNLTFGEYGALNNCHPYSYIFGSGGGNNKVRIRNAGTMTAPLSCGSSSTLYPQYVAYMSQGNTDLDVRYQRLFFSGVRFNICEAASGTGNSSGNLYEHISNSYSFRPFGSIPPNSTMRGVWGSAPTGVDTSVGSNFYDCFSSDTGGHLVFNASTITSTSSPYYTASLAASPFAGFQSATTIGLPTSGDYIIFETPYWVKGHSSFKNVSATTTLSGSYTLQYQIDTGSGWNGTWKTISGANLSAESISASGFKMKVKITANSSSTSNTFTVLRIDTNSSISDRNSNLYSLDTVTLSFENLQPGSEVRAYVGTDPATSVEIGGIESVSGTTWSFTHSSAGQDGYIAVFALGYIPLIIPRTYASVDSTLLISQVVDRNYVNP